MQHLLSLAPSLSCLSLCLSGYMGKILLGIFSGSPNYLPLQIFHQTKFLNLPYN